MAVPGRSYRVGPDEPNGYPSLVRSGFALNQTAQAHGPQSPKLQFSWIGLGSLAAVPPFEPTCLQRLSASEKRLSGEYTVR